MVLFSSGFLAWLWPLGPAKHSAEGLELIGPRWMKKFSLEPINKVLYS